MFVTDMIEANVNEKAAIVRVLSDLVKSDNVISVKELDSLKYYYSEFDICETDEYAGNGMTLQRAFDILSKSKKPLKDAVEKAMSDEKRGIAMADNECCREEAMLIVAFRYAMRKNSEVKVCSMPFRNRPILDSQIVFLENPASSPTGGDVLGADGHRPELVNQVRNIVEAAGFELVYIPEIKNSLTKWDKLGKSRTNGNLKRVFHLISPTLPEKELSNMVDDVKGVTTQRFYNDMLCSPAGLDMPLDIDKPSWLIRLCNSNLNGVGYANFLSMPLEFENGSTREDRDRDIRKQMHDFVDDLNALQGSYSIVVNKHRTMGEDFQYGGFYKVLFDSLLNRKRVPMTLTISDSVFTRSLSDDNDRSGGKRCQMYMTEEGKVTGIPIVGMDIAFYTLVLCMKNHGGLNTRDSKLMQSLFEIVYREIYGERGNDENGSHYPDIVSNPANLRQVKYRIKRGLSSVPDEYAGRLGLVSENGVINVNADLSIVRVKISTKEYALLDSEIYERVKDAVEKEIKRKAI